MNLHRDVRKYRRWAASGVGYSVAAAAIGTALALLVGGPGWAFALVWWLTGVFGLIAGVGLFAASLSRFQIRLEETGLLVHANGHRFTGPWSQVRAISIEQIRPGGGPSGTEPALVLWVGDAPMRKRPTFPPSGDGPRGHVLATLDDLVETPTQVEQALRRYAGDKFRSPIRT